MRPTSHVGDRKILQKNPPFLRKVPGTQADFVCSHICWMLLGDGELATAEEGRLALRPVADVGALLYHRLMLGVERATLISHA